MKVWRLTSEKEQRSEDMLSLANQYTVLLGGIPKERWGKDVRPEDHQRELICTGVLIQTGGHYGIATAGHCIERMVKQAGTNRREEIAVAVGTTDSRNREQKIGMVFPSSKRIWGKTGALVKPQGWEQTRGKRWPDIGIIWIGEGSQESIRAECKKQFYRLDIERDVPELPGKGATIGVVASTNKELEDGLRDEDKEVIKVASLFGVADYERKNKAGWAEVTLDMGKPKTNWPHDFGGTSGSGIWIGREAKNSRIDAVRLTGIITTQHPERQRKGIRTVFLSGHDWTDVENHLAEDDGF